MIEAFTTVVSPAAYARSGVMADALGRPPKDPGEPYEGKRGQSEEQQDRRFLQKELHYDDRNGKKGRHTVNDLAH